MDAFPAFFPLSGATVVIAGTGQAAEAKLRLFAGSPAVVRRLEGDRALEPQAYAGAALAFVASDDEAFSAAAAAAARAAGVPVNVADRPALCDFTTPSIIDRGEVVAAVGTGGASPMLATLLRHDIEARVPQGAGRIAALFRTTQDEVRTALPDLPQRRAFLRAALSGPIAEAALGDDMPLAIQRLRAALVAFEPQAGRVDFIDARGPADLMTLGAARALAAADVVAAHNGACADILDLARRDAERLEGNLGAERLAELACRGLRVALLHVGGTWQADLDAIRALGVEAAPA